MNGFDNQYWGCGHGSSQPPCPNATHRTATFRPAKPSPYFYLGEHYVLADQMYASNVDATQLYLASVHIRRPGQLCGETIRRAWWGCEGTYSNYISTLTSARQLRQRHPDVLDNKTLGDEMDGKGLSWAYYASKIYGRRRHLDAYQNISQTYNGPDWKRTSSSPQTDFLQRRFQEASFAT